MPQRHRDTETGRKRNRRESLFSLSALWLCGSVTLWLVLQQEPVEAVLVERELIGARLDARERLLVLQVHRRHPLIPAQVEQDGLRRPREVIDAEHGFALVTPRESQNLPVLRVEEFERPAAEYMMLFPHHYHLAHPVQQRRRVAMLRLDVDRLIAVNRVHVQREIQLREIGS